MAIHSVSTSTGEQGFAGFAQYLYTSNQYKIWWTESIVTAAFNPELGFVSRSDVIGRTPGINWYYRGNKLPFRRWIRAFEPGFLPEIYHQASTGKLIESQLTLFPFWLNLQNGGYIGYSINPTVQRLTEAFQPLGVTIPVGNYRYARQQLWLGSDPSKIVNVSAQYEWGTYFDGKLSSFDGRVQFAPIPHISLTGRINSNRFREVGDARTTTAVNLYALEGRLALNPRVQLIGFYQQNTENKSSNYNIRLSWEYQPLSFLYIVLNHRSFNTTQLSQSRSEDHAIAKLSYLRQL